MACNPRDLSVLAFANGFTLWHYRTSDEHHAMISAGYWSPAHSLLKEDDRIVADGGHDYVVAYRTAVDKKLDEAGVPARVLVRRVK